MNSLAREVGLKMGPVMLGTLVTHWFDRLKKDAEDGTADSGARLKEDDILYHQAFTLIKAFLEASTNHTIEDLQSFANTRTLSPPWVHVVRTLVPLSCCEEAATYLVKALGGEDVARQIVGGIKWWQVRGVQGIQAQWITEKKDWQEAKRRHKMQKDQAPKDLLSQPTPPVMNGKESRSSSGDSGTYDKDMDAMRCILYLHGGGYYFGSVDQSRYSIQRHARKINGRVFAIDYRLAPQYPFPCALHDALAAYLFLIRPPLGSSHEAVNPAHIIVSGDSAGGGLSLALLQVIRDSGLPLPAGGVLISPWCDLTHSFPSLHSNVDSDIIPESGLAFHKPSLLWPPPSPDFSKRVHASLRFRIKQVFKPDDSGGQFSQTSTIMSEKDINPDTTDPEFVSSVTSLPGVIKMSSGEIVEIKDQLQFYAQNRQLSHPLVSPITSYLGGLPPLLFIAGDDEVLRDEIIYTAHKAAYPEQHPVVEHARLLYPILQGIEDRHKPTSVHLQVYDGAPHVLPVLFLFTTPAKFCFRAIANFNRFVTDMKAMPSRSSSTLQMPPTSRRKSLFSGFLPSHRSGSRVVADAPLVASPGLISEIISPTSPVSIESEHLLLRQTSSSLSHSGGLLRRHHTLMSPALAKEPGSYAPERPTDRFPFPEEPEHKTSNSSSGDSSAQDRPQTPGSSTERTAGEPEVYIDIKNRSNWECRMIRERVSTSGVIRPLEPAEELDAFKVPRERVAQLTEEVIQRYLKHKQKSDKKYEHALKSIEKDRHYNIARAKQDTIKRVHVLRQTIGKGGEGGEIVEGHQAEVKAQMKVEDSGRASGKSKVDWRALSSPGWVWAWALDELEDPPPSSIVARRDTEEARKLAAVADLIHTRDQDQNDLWTMLHKFFTGAPGKGNVLIKPRHEESSKHMKMGGLEGSTSGESRVEGRGDSAAINENRQVPKRHTSSIFAKLPLISPNPQNASES